MTSIFRSLLLLLGVASLWLALLGSEARAQSSSSPRKAGSAAVASKGAPSAKRTCAKAYERAQESRFDARMQEAKQHLLICAQPACASFIRSDCSRWLTELEQELPSVVLAARARNGSEAVDVRVFVDGQVRTERLDGKALAIDPGQHVFRFEKAGEPPIERRVLVRQGERNRLVAASWYVEPARPSSSGTFANSMGKPGPLRPYAYVLGGVSAAGLLSFGIFGLVGHQREKEISEDCRERVSGSGCSVADVDEAKRLLVIADVSLIGGAAAFVLGTVFFVASEPRENEAPRGGTVRVDFAAQKGGGLATVSGQF